MDVVFCCHTDECVTCIRRNRRSVHRQRIHLIADIRIHGEGLVFPLIHIHTAGWRNLPVVSGCRGDNMPEGFDINAEPVVFVHIRERPRCHGPLLNAVSHKLGDDESRMGCRCEGEIRAGGDPVALFPGQLRRRHIHRFRERRGVIRNFVFPLNKRIFDECDADRMIHIHI